MAALPSEMTIDCHAHVFTSGMALHNHAWTKPRGDASIETYRSLLKRAGITHAVLAASSLHADDNRYALSVTRADPHIRTTVIVPPDISREQLEGMAANGACGIRLQLRNKPLPDLRSRDYQQLLRHVSDLGWHVQLHDDSHRLAPMMEVIEASGARLVVDHFGRPGPEGIDDPGFRAVLAAVARGRTWVKIASAFRLEPPEHDRALADALLAVRGPDRLMWGSDWPFVGFEEGMTYDRALRDYVRAVPDAAARAAIDVTARRFYFEEDDAGRLD